MISGQRAWAGGEVSGVGVLRSSGGGGRLTRRFRGQAQAAGDAMADMPLK